MSGYIGAKPFTQGERNSTNHEVVGGETVFNAVYTPGFLDVILNGVILYSTEYTATDGVSFTLNTPTGAGDTLTSVAWGTFSTADTVSPAEMDAAIEAANGDMLWAVIDGQNGNIISGGGMTCSYDGTGSYNITLDEPRATADYVIQASGQRNAETDPVNCYIARQGGGSPQTINSFGIRTVDHTSTLKNCYRLYITVMG